MPRSVLSRVRILVSVLSIVILATVGCKPETTPSAAEKPTGTPHAGPVAASTGSQSATQESTAADSAASGGQVASAMEWYAMAEDAALAWQADAVLISAVGGNRAADLSPLPCDGNAGLWTYSFVSVAARKRLQVAVRGGTVSILGDNDLKHGGKPYTDEEMLWVKDLYPAGDWKVDSTQAAETANARFKEKYSTTPDHIAYTMFNSKRANMSNMTLTNDMYWVISYDPERYRFQVNIGARTGEERSTQ